MYRHSRFVVVLMVLFITQLSCNPTDSEVSFLEGRWEIDEMYSSGLKSSLSKGWISFRSDGTYAARLDMEAAPIQGHWDVSGDVIRLWQEEVKDLNGNRFLEPYRSSWNYEVVGDFLVMEGLPDGGVQHLKLILKKSES